MGRATWYEAIGAGQIVLLIDGFQHHRHGSLSDLVLEGRDAERPLRTVRLQNVGPADRRCLIPARLDAIEEVTKIGLQVRLIDRRRDTVDAGSPILAVQPVGLLHPVHIDDMVQRVQRLSAPSPGQFGYPLSFGGQVRRVQCPSRVSGQRSSLRDASLPSIGSRRARFPDFSGTTKALRLPVCVYPVPYGSGSRLHVLLRVRVRHGAPAAAKVRSRARGLWSAGLPPPAGLPGGTHGSLRFPGAPSHTFARISDPGRTSRTSPLSVLPMLPPGPIRRRLQQSVLSGLNPGLWCPLPTLH